MIECGCGGNMHGTCPHDDKHTHVYFRCGLHAARFFELEGRECQQTPVWGDVLDLAVWRYAERIIGGDFEAELRAAQAAEQDAVQPQRAELEAVESLISDAEAARNVREMSEYKESERDRPSYKALRKQRDEADARHAELVKRRARVIEAIEQGALSDRQIETMLEYRQTTLIGMDNLIIADKCEMLEALQTHVKVNGHKAIIRCRLKVPPDEVDLCELRNSARWAGSARNARA